MSYSLSFDLCILSILFFAITAAQVTQPNQLPGFNDLNICVQGVFGGYYGLDGSYLGSDIGCDSWNCVCESIAAARPVGTSLASRACSGRTSDINAESSVLDGFCAQLNPTANPGAATATDNIPASPTATVPTAPIFTGTCTGYYNFTISTIDVIQQRSQVQDTILIASSLAIGPKIYSLTGYFGRHKQSLFNANITFLNIPIHPSDIVVFAYLVINSDHGNRTDVENQLEAAAVGLALQGVQSTNPTDPNVATSIGITIGRTFARIISFVIDLVEGIVELFTQGCDGWLAGGVHGFTGEDICTGQGTSSTGGTDISDGAEDEKLFGILPGIICNINPSKYGVSWNAFVSDGIGGTSPDTQVVNSGAMKLVGKEGGWLLVLAVASVLYLQL